MRVTFPDSRSNGHTWIAEITGPDPKYGFARRFLKGWRISDTIAFELERGCIYDINCPDQLQREFACVNFREDDLDTRSYYEVCRAVREAVDGLEYKPVMPFWVTMALMSSAPVIDDMSDR